MSSTLTAALQLTVIGMGMTFLSIGALTLGMYVLTRLTQEKEAPAPSDIALEAQARAMGADLEDAQSPDAVDLAGDPAPTPSQGEDARRRQAAAAAVAVALSQHASSGPRYAVSGKDGRAVGADAWTTYVRGQLLSRRVRHDLRNQH